MSVFERERIVSRFRVDLGGLEVELYRPRFLMVGKDLLGDPGDYVPTVWIEHLTYPANLSRGSIPSNLVKLTVKFVTAGVHIGGDEWEHVGSAQCGPYPWHVYARKEIQL